MKVSEWLERILGHEGGYTCNPDDPGNWTGGECGSGELLGTRWGISASAYPRQNIPRLTIDEAAEIYTRDYLAPLGADELRDGIAFQLLDFSVNSGQMRAVLTIQRELGVTTDGIIGPVTRGAMQSRSESDIIMLLTAGRLDFLTGLDTWDSFGKGWARRIAANLRYGVEDS